MKFDETKVHTPFNVDGAKIGSKGYFADNKVDLMIRVQSENKHYYCELGNYNKNDIEHPFVIGDNTAAYRYFYLVEEPKEPKKRPCTREELIEMLKKQGLPMLKHLSNVVRTVISIHQENVFDEVGAMTYFELCEQYTLLDGTELWVEE